MTQTSKLDFNGVIRNSGERKLIALSYAGRDCAAMLQVMITEECDYVLRNNLGDPEKLDRVKWGRAALKSWQEALEA